MDTIWLIAIAIFILIGVQFIAYYTRKDFSLENSFDISVPSIISILIAIAISMYKNDTSTSLTIILLLIFIGLYLYGLIQYKKILNVKYIIHYLIESIVILAPILLVPSFMEIIISLDKFYSNKTMEIEIDTTYIYLIIISQILLLIGFFIGKKLK